MNSSSISSSAIPRPIKTLIVDDAPIMRKAIQQIVGKSDQIEVIGTAANGQECLHKIDELQPDVITLDIDMPVMNGITAVKNIMVRHQKPVVIISSLVRDGYFAFEALRLGVVDFIPKPSRTSGDEWESEENLVRLRVLLASGMQVTRMRRVRRHKLGQSHFNSNRTAPTAAVLMGTNLAGPNAIMHIITTLPRDFAGAVIAVQEIHPRILGPFCSYFNMISPLEVHPVADGCQLLAGRVYVGSTFTGIHVTRASGGGYVLRVSDSTSSPIDTLFESTARQFMENTCGVLMTGVGSDGAAGLRSIRMRGGLTIGQKQECCAYPNLVQHAADENVLDKVLPRRGIASQLQQWLHQRRVYRAIATSHNA